MGGVLTRRGLLRIETRGALVDAGATRHGRPRSRPDSQLTHAKVACDAENGGVSPWSSLITHSAESPRGRMHAKQKGSKR